MKHKIAISRALSLETPTWHSSWILSDLVVNDDRVHTCFVSSRYDAEATRNMGVEVLRSKVMEVEGKAWPAIERLTGRT